ncbi:Stp1/IreP family PP2C-type Ser/Thr phosphatase [Pokkaliibacter sp. CJK22405]|uniref:Stp1/IreP family PP2C-type Ser/Thr phosphatase n=1 Tax=Pokkaliibacter sp. CJK22405 TaxID=3384615 RepID=UPI003984822A
MVSYAQTHVGRVRDHNEDAYLEMSEKGLWVVADGMGGHAAGEVASQMVVDTLEMELGHIPRNSLTAQHVSNAIKAANRSVHDYASRVLQGKTLGSTVVALLVNGNEFHYCWVGDSRGYLFRQGQLRQITRDHSQVQDLVDEGMLDQEEAEHHPLANVVTRAIGGQTEVDVDVISGTLQPGDLFLLCSDGLSKELSFDQIHKILNTPSVVDACMALTHSALVNGGRDNVTSVLVRAFEQSPQVEDATVPVLRR